MTSPVPDRAATRPDPATAWIDGCKPAGATDIPLTEPP
jgi:hypothetical protein